MRAIEQRQDYVNGGILADVMGLGKTLQMIANIVYGSPSLKASEVGQTLIVAPTNLVGQWEREIAKHVGDVEATIGTVSQYFSALVLSATSIGDPWENSVKNLLDATWCKLLTKRL